MAVRIIAVLLPGSGIRDPLCNAMQPIRVRCGSTSPKWAIFRNLSGELWRTWQRRAVVDTA